LNHLQGDLRKFKTPSFYRENKKGEEVESWSLGIRKYFHLDNYPSNVEARVSIYHLQGNDSIWWNKLKQVKHINENKINWKQFKKYF